MKNDRILTRGMQALLGAQFFSALADNAALIAAIALVKSRGMDTEIPLLQEAFVVPFILFAPFAGQFADAWPKKWAMLVSNLVKILGAALLAVGFPPLASYGVIGVGATLYSPAKYGILSQMFDFPHLVRANGWLESSTIAAILLGSVLGGWLSDRSLFLAFAGVGASYLIASVLNLAVPRLPAVAPGFSWRGSWRQFASTLFTLAKNRDARFSLIGSSLFWGSGTTLRLMLFIWVPVALGARDNETPASLLALISVGIVVGALFAGRWISLEHTKRALAGGLLLGPLVLLLAQTHRFFDAALITGLLGFCGGLFLVPLNALLQARGQESVGAGRALAAQNFCENLSMLFFVGIYSLATAAALPVMATTYGFGSLLFLAMAALAFSRSESSKT